ncbi:zinc-dependent alcohol dehydrogenase family protein [Solimonas terrae]|uniref:Alcohol dehydrogenase catalytic domain-containing protein n=1 Tax=Solimonas terrae TaxID=1396819 RepID=A0A6M2BRQ1_9GAMM|nr:zinc-dependent alcohol dehydrogenase family protein [Solimonas terrae]NGY05312.1 alcohol dehydrogenase catalytic domain-containing protein [Solimonas terrae]
MKVRAAVLREMGRSAPFAQSRPLVIETVQLDPPGPDELLVKLRAAGLCHSDLSVIDGSRPRVMPMVLGHEAAGEVLAIGRDVHDFAVGDQVVFAFVPACGHCAYCAEGRAALCEPGARANTAGTLLSGARRWRGDAPELHHHLGVSAFAEATVVSARSAVRIAPSDDGRPLDWTIAALFGCAVLTGVGAVVNTARVAPGDSVAIFGLGGVGLAALLGALASGADPVVAVDVLPAKLELARQLGATHTVLATEADAVARIRDATGGGAQHSIETAGSELALAAAYAATRRGGTTITAGLPHPDRRFSVPAVSLVAEERTVKGSYMGSAVPARDLPRFVALYRAGKLPVDRLLTHRLKLDEINLGFDRLARGEAVRQVIVFE